jgi:hypothetical protein
VARADLPTYEIDSTSYAAYELVYLAPLARWIEFTLTEDMGETTAGEATAAVDAAFQGASPGSSTTVHDPQDAFLRALFGAKGVAAWDDEAEQYKIVRCQQRAAMCRGLIKGAMTTGDASHTVDNVSPLAGQSPVTSAAATLTVENLFHWNAADNAVCVFAWDETADEWILLQVECSA